MSGQDVTATAYLIVQATRRQWGAKDPETGLLPIESARIAAVRAGRPSRLERDQVLVKVAVQLPTSVFDPIMPSALIVVPEDLVLDRHVVEVEAVGDPQAEDTTP